MKQIITFITLLVACLGAWGQSHTISGTVAASSSGETLISATVYDMVSGKGALTNAQGRYSLVATDHDSLLCVHYPGKEMTIVTRNSGQRVLDITLAEKTSGVPQKPAIGERIVADVIYRDGTVIDHIRNVAR